MRTRPRPARPKASIRHPSMEALDVRRLLAAHWASNAIGLPDGQTSYFQAPVVIGDRVLYAGSGPYGPANYIDIYTASTARWMRTTAPQGLSASPVVVAGKVIYLNWPSLESTLGPDRAEIYDPSTNAWSEEPLPAQLGAGATVGHKAFFVGRPASYAGTLPAPPMTLLGIYDSQADQWTTVSLPPEDATDANVAASAGGAVVFSDGSNALVYDTLTGDFSTHALTGNDRRYATELAVGDEVLFYGGTYVDRHGRTIGSSDVDVYDAATRIWSVARLSSPGSVAAVAAGSHVVIAPSDSDEAAPRAPGPFVVDVFDATTGTWSTTRMPAGTGKPYGAVALDGKALFGTDNVVDAYDPSTGTWSQTAGLVPMGGFETVVGVGHQLLVTNDYYDGPVPARAANVFSLTRLPGVPVPLAPIRRHLVATAHPTFSWAPVADATQYDLYLTEYVPILYGDAPPPAATTTATHVTVPTRVGGGPRGWVVVAHTPGGNIASAVSAFALPAPVLRASIKRVRVPSPLTDQSTGSVSVRVRNVGNAPLVVPVTLAAQFLDSEGHWLGDVGKVVFDRPLSVGQSVTVRIPLAFQGADTTSDGHFAIIAYRGHNQGESALVVGSQSLVLQSAPAPSSTPPPPLPPRGANTAAGHVRSVARAAARRTVLPDDDWPASHRPIAV